MMKEKFLMFMFETAFNFINCDGLVVKVDKTVHVETICKKEVDRGSYMAKLEKDAGVELTKGICSTDNVETPNKKYFSRCTYYIKDK